MNLPLSPGKGVGGRDSSVAGKDAGAGEGSGGPEATNSAGDSNDSGTGLNRIPHPLSLFPSLKLFLFFSFLLLLTLAGAAIEENSGDNDEIAEAPLNVQTNQKKEQHNTLCFSLLARWPHPPRLTTRHFGFQRRNGGRGESRHR